MKNRNLTYSRMTGLFQTSFYFGYTAILSLGMFCMLGKEKKRKNMAISNFFFFLFYIGFVGHLAASKFVRKIYQNVKID